ncbi:thymidylate synthase [Leptospira wolffii]|uniref:thymidylate synthase n=1 Tax=Leptospira wolffii TaxID=409998 RepID=UPI001083C6AF|nr:thymidylate synthase [Leptospira wolffii]TGL50811.1 thymidylate synthase [Leptospira wolffii]
MSVIQRTENEKNLSTAWGKAIVQLKKDKRTRNSPLLISFTGITNDCIDEDLQIRAIVDKILITKKKHTIREVAYTIFPNELWNLTKRSKSTKEFYELYTTRALLKMKKRDPANNYGTYFERMISFSGWKKEEMRKVNQLEFVIGLLKKKQKIRLSALQIALFDPAKDHTGQAQRGFPCLQQIGISYEKEGFMLNAFYPSQYMIERAYGNYLGLANLANFISSETGMKVEGVNVFIAKPSLDISIDKSSFNRLKKILEL